MKDQAPRDPYEARIRRVIRHIHENPGADLSLDALADVAAMSRFHWHRIFAAVTGETLAAAARRIRLHRAAVWLVATDLPVPEIARRVGYQNPRSFARTFRDAFGATPAAFRAEGRAPAAPEFRTAREEIAMHDVEIAEAPARRAAALPHTGAYHEIGKAFEQLGAIAARRGLWPVARGMVGVYHDDPRLVPAERLRSHAGLLVDEDFAIPADLDEVRMAAGPVAVLHFKGPYAGLPAAYDYLFGTWLPQSGAEPSEAPCYEIYLNDPTDTAPADLLTEICVPLAAR